MSWLPLRGRNLAKVPKQHNLGMEEAGKPNNSRDEKLRNFNRIINFSIKTSECDEPAWLAGSQAHLHGKTGKWLGKTLWNAILPHVFPKQYQPQSLPSTSNISHNRCEFFTQPTGTWAYA